MSRIAICTDASALVPLDVAAAEALTVVPIPILLDGRPFDERLGVDAFYSALEAGAHATTSQPSPGDLQAAYAAAAARGAREVVSIHLDARTSGTVAAAELAARETPVRVTVVDTRTASFGVGVCVCAAVELVSGGASADEVVEGVTELGATIRNAFVAASAPGGRVSPSTASAVLAFAAGAVRQLANVAGEAQAIAAMTAAVAGSGSQVCAAVGHASSSTETAANSLAEAIAAHSHVSAVERYRVGPAVGAHTGAHSFGVFWWPAGPRPPEAGPAAATSAGLTSGSDRGSRSPRPE